MSHCYHEYFNERVKAQDQELRAKLASTTKELADTKARLAVAASPFKRALGWIAGFALGACITFAWLYLASAPCSRCDAEFYQYQYQYK